MPKILDLTMETVDTYTDVFDKYNDDTDPAFSFGSGYVSIKNHFDDDYHPEGFVMRLTKIKPELLPMKVPLARMQYNYKIEIAMQTITNCINYGGYMFTGVWTPVGDDILAIGLMTVRIGSVNSCAYGAWKFVASTLSWTTINETSYVTSPFDGADAVLQVYLKLKYITESIFKFYIDVYHNGSYHVLDTEITTTGSVAAFLNKTWRVGSVMKKLDEDEGNYTEWRIKRVVVT